MPRFKIGKQRPLQVIFSASPDEDELLTRAAYELKTTKNALIRGQILPKDLKYELARLRRIQKGVRGIKFRRSQNGRAA